MKVGRERTGVTGVLVLRVWLTQDHQPQLRVRIITILDVERADRTERAVASVDDVCREVRAWLEEFVRQ
jgi:hypothetical protein